MVNFFTAILLILIAESFLFGAQLLGYKNIKSVHNRILGILMNVMGVFFTISLFKSITYYHIAIHTYYLLIPLFLSINPFYFLYVKALTYDKYKFSAKTLIHFIPAALVLLLNLFFYMPLSEEAKISLITHSVKKISEPQGYDSWVTINQTIETIGVFFYYIQLFYYVFLMIVMLKNHQTRIKYFFSYENNISLKWLKSFVGIIVVNSSLELFILLFSLYFHQLPIEISYAYYFFIFLLITTLGYFGIKQTDIYLPSPEKQAQIVDQTTSNQQDQIDEKFDDFDLFEKPDEDLEIHPIHFMISDEEQNRIVNSVIKLIEEDRMFQNPKLSVYDLANKLNTNKTYISVAINNILKKNFRQFINEYRIEEAKKLLVDPTFDHISIEGIGQTVGFISKSTFNLAFKKYSNEKPSDFRRNNR